jgi:hypothetical protein
MKVLDVIHVTGRGWVVVCDEDDELTCGDIVCVKDREFTINGIEKATNISQVGFVLSPNNKVKKNIAIGDSVCVCKLYGRCKNVKAYIKVTLQKPILIYADGGGKIAKFIEGDNLMFYERKGVCYVMVGRFDVGPLLPIKEKFDELEGMAVK